MWRISQCIGWKNLSEFGQVWWVLNANAVKFVVLHWSSPQLAWVMLAQGLYTITEIYSHFPMKSVIEKLKCSSPIHVHKGNHAPNSHKSASHGFSIWSIFYSGLSIYKPAYPTVFWPTQNWDHIRGIMRVQEAWQTFFQFPRLSCFTPQRGTVSLIPPGKIEKLQPMVLAQPYGDWCQCLVAAPSYKNVSIRTISGRFGCRLIDPDRQCIWFKKNGECVSTIIFQFHAKWPAPCWGEGSFCPPFWIFPIAQKWQKISTQNFQYCKLG